MASSVGAFQSRSPICWPEVWRRGSRRPSSRRARSTFGQEPSVWKRAKTTPKVRWIDRSGSLVTVPSGSRRSPVGSCCRSVPRSTCRARPAASRKRRTWSSASLHIPRKPSRRRSLSLRGSYTPSASPMSVPTTVARSRRVYQSALLRASRLASSASTIPTCPSDTSATTSWNPARCPSWPDCPRSASMTRIRSGAHPRARARSTKAYWFT
jgi:hypothetical protein